MNYNNFPIQEQQLLATNTHIGMRLRTRRKELRLTQQSLASAINISYQQIQKYEKGINRIAADRLYFLAILLGVDISYFFLSLNQIHEGDDEKRKETHNSLSMNDINPAVRSAIVNLIEVMNKPRKPISSKNLTQ